MNERKLGFIGVGNMGGAIMDGIIEKGAVPADKIAAYDVYSDGLARFTEKGVLAVKSISELCERSEMVLLCVKPNVAKEALKASEGRLENKALMSIVAGTSCSLLMEYANANCRVLRIMSNTPAMVNCGATVLCTNTTFEAAEKMFAEKVFEAIGVIEWLPEYLIDAVTGLIGGGPAYIAMFLEALADGAVFQGIPRNIAYNLAAQTMAGTAKMLTQTGFHPGHMKDMVCSPGGTTIEGVRALEEGGMRAAVMNAVIMSTDKSRRLV